MLALPPAPWTLHYRVRVTWLTRSGSDKGTSSTTRDRTTQQNRGRTPLGAVSHRYLLFFQASLFWLHSEGEDGEVGLLFLTCTSIPSLVQSIKLFNVDGGVFVVLLACSMTSAQTHTSTQVLMYRPLIIHAAPVCVGASDL